MPLYEYECQQCSHRIEKIQSFSAPPETICPKCGGPLERLISAPAIQFKGSGWYVSDYAKSGAAAKKAGDAGTPEGGGSADGAKDGAKPGEKTTGGEAGTKTAPAAPAPAPASSSASTQK